MHTFRLFAAVLLLILADPAFATEFTEGDFKTLVRAGCVDDAECCEFGHWKLARDAPVFDDVDSLTRVATLKKGEEIQTIAGRVETTPGRLRVLHDHDDFKKGQVIGLYTPIRAGKLARVGSTEHLVMVDAPFLARKKSCARQPSEECWAQPLSSPKTQWWIKVRLKDGKPGWVDQKNFVRGSEC